MRKFFAVAAIFISSQLHAQEQKDSSKTMDPVTLTANKYSVKTSETGKVVTVISRQDIEHAGSRDLSQVITELGGVFINGYTSKPGKEKNIYLRGAKVDHTLITVDGIPVYDATGIGSNFDIRNISIDNVERIEILKGSQSTLYGSDAIAGVINIITKKGGTKPFALSGTAHYGSYNSIRTNVSVNGNIQSFDYNAGYSYSNTDGFSEAQRPEGSTTKFDNDPFRENSLQANFGIQASKQIRIQPFIRYSKFKGSLDLDSYKDETDFTSETKNFQTGIKNIIGIGKGQLNLLYMLTNTKRYYLDDSISRPGYFVYSQQNYLAHEHFGEAFVVYPFKAIKLTAGADFRSSKTDYNAVQKNIYSPAITKPAFSGDSINHHQFGMYAALNYSANDFAIEGGTRMNNHSEYGNNFAFNINPSYLVQNKFKLFANISSGYKTPSLYQLFSNYGNRELKPETSINLEGGVQYFSKDQKLSLRANYFNRKVKDAIAFFYNSTTFRSNYINQDELKDHGFEFEANGKFSEKLDLKAIYSYVDGEISTKQNGKDTTYFNLLRRPKSSFNLFLGSQLTKALYINAQLNAIGERKDLYYDDNFVRHDVILKSYMLLNFYLEYGFLQNKLKIFADLRNITDKKYSDIVGYSTAGFNGYSGIRFRL